MKKKIDAQAALDARYDALILIATTNYKNAQDALATLNKQRVSEQGNLNLFYDAVERLPALQAIIATIPVDAQDK